MCSILIIMMMRRLEKSFGENDPWSASGKLCRGGDTTSHINSIIIINININGSDWRWGNGIACGVIDDGGLMVNLVMMDLELLTMVLSSMMVVLMTLVNLVTMVVLQTTRAISDVECWIDGWHWIKHPPTGRDMAASYLYHHIIWLSNVHVYLDIGTAVMYNMLQNCIVICHIWGLFYHFIKKKILRQNFQKCLRLYWHHVLISSFTSQMTEKYSTAMCYPPCYAQPGAFLRLPIRKAIWVFSG